VEGVRFFDTLRQHPISESEEPFHYSSLRGQQNASLFTEVTLDNVLIVLVEERHDHKWSWDIVVDNGLIFGSLGTEPCASREEAEQRALAGLAMIGRSAEPAPDYVPETEPDKKLQIRVNGIGYVVPKLSDDPGFGDVLNEGMRIAGTTYDGLLARLANLVVVDGVENHTAAMTILANCGWADVTQEILESFCAANGIDEVCNSEDVPKMRESFH